LTVASEELIVTRTLHIFFTALATSCAANVDLNQSSSQVGAGAFISGNARINDDCSVSSERLLSIGQYDIGAVEPKATSCLHPYKLALSVSTTVNSVVLFDQANISLKTSNNELITFQTPDNEPLSNPYDVVCSGRVKPDKHEGTVSFQAIPVKYASQLATVIDDGVVIEVKLQGDTPEGRKVSTQPFRFPIEICRSCLTLCRSELLEGGSVRDMSGAECADNADGRYCVDSGC
jgi:hypothetical protein